MPKLGSTLIAIIPSIAAMIGGLVALPRAAFAQSLGQTPPEQYSDQSKTQGRSADQEQAYKRALAISEQAFGPDHPYVAVQVNNLAVLYLSEGRIAEAEPLYKRALAISEKALGPDHPDFVPPLTNLANLYEQLGRYADAENLYKRALAITEKAPSSDRPDVSATLNNLSDLYHYHPDVAFSLGNLAELYSRQTRYGDAEPLYKRALAISEKALGPDHPDVVPPLTNLAELYLPQARYAEAEPLLKRALAIREKALGPDDLDVAASLAYLGNLYEHQGRYPEAEPLLRRALAIGEKTLQPNSPVVAQALYALASLFEQQGRYADAESLDKRALAIEEKTIGPDHPDVAAMLSILANLYTSQGRYAEAEPLYKRALTIREKVIGLDHPDVASTLFGLASLYEHQGRNADAKPLFSRALDIWEKSYGPSHPGVAAALGSLASLYQDQGRFAEAEPLDKLALAIDEKALGPDHPNVAIALSNLSSLYVRQGRISDAEPLLTRALAVSQKALETNHPYVRLILNNLAALYGQQGRFADALPIIRRAIEQHNIFSAAVAFDVLAGAERGQLDTGEQAFRDSYDVLQFTSSSAASEAVEKLALRFAAGSGPLAEIVRKDEDLTAEAGALDASLIAAASKAPSERNRGAEDQVRKRLADIAVEKADILNLMEQKFPNYVALSKPEPLTLESTETLLGDDEAVVALHIGEKDSYAWVVTNTEGRWTEIPVNAKTLRDQVAELRQSLTFTFDRPFDAALSYKIYQETLGPIAANIAGKKRLSVLADGALTSIPLGLLVASDPTGKSLKDVDWLINSHAITVLPSIYSLKTMRARAPVFDAPKPMIAFADPVFSQQAKAEAKTPRVILRSLASFYQGSEIDVRALGEALPQLPRTREEVRRVGKALGAGPDDMKFGLDATVTAVERAPLDQYRVVYFATHGLVAGDLAKFAKAKAEPALVLTIPDNPTEADNGLLTASAVAQLKLNADWIVLSACNTASSDGVGAEALSGLARAFIYAGARSLVVSNWDISDEATADLMTNLFDISAKSPTLSHGEAMQQATLRLLAAAKTEDAAHPRVWAPFMVVGEPEAGK